MFVLNISTNSALNSSMIFKLVSNRFGAKLGGGVPYALGGE